MSFSFLHTADWQLGAKQHPIAYENFLEKLIEKSRELETDFILCVGDIFDEHNPNPIWKDHLLRKIINNQDQRFVFTVGNHDYTTKAREYHSLKYLKLVSKLLKDSLFICDDIGGRYLIPIDKYELRYVTIFPTEIPYSVVPKSPQKKGSPKQEEFIVTCFHGMLPHFSVKGQNSKKQITKDIKDLLKATRGHYAALGDIHKNILVEGLGGYPGALVQKTYACEDGIIHVRVDDDHNVETELLHLNLPKKINVPIEIDSLNEEEIVEFVNEEIPHGNLIKIQFSIPSQEYTAINKDYIEKKLAKDFLEIKFSNDPVIGIKKRENLDTIKKAKNIEEEIEPIVEEMKDLDKKTLIKKCKEYL